MLWVVKSSEGPFVLPVYFVYMFNGPNLQSSSTQGQVGCGRREQCPGARKPLLLLVVESSAESYNFAIQQYCTSVQQPFADVIRPGSVTMQCTHPSDAILQRELDAARQAKSNKAQACCTRILLCDGVFGGRAAVHSNRVLLTTRVCCSHPEMVCDPGIGRWLLSARTKLCAVQHS
jgi:hypothetical protein